VEECKPLQLGRVERKLVEISDQLSAQATMTRELLGRVRPTVP
jgi:hypothetical protein